MPIPKGLCSHCGKDFNNCECAEFHPNLPEGLVVDKEKIDQLLEFFYMDVGYISHDKYPLIHEFITELENYAKENQKDSSETGKREEKSSNL